MQKETASTPMDGSLIIPDYGPESILGLSNGILDYFGVAPLHPALPIRQLFGESQNPEKSKIILFILDAFGWHSFLHCLKDPVFSELTSPFSKLRISSTFPTTTTAALTTLYTASTPLEHGMLGYILYLKRFFSLVNMLDISPVGMDRDLLTHHGFNPFKWLPVKTIFEKLSRTGVKCLSVTSNLFKNSGLSKMHHVGSTLKGYSDMVDMVLLLKRALEEEGPLFVFGYWGLTDSFGHQYGPFSPEYGLELKTFFYLLRNVFEDYFERREHQDTGLLISADHGQLETVWSDEEWISPKDKLVKEFLDIPPFGEPRALYFIPKEGKAFQQYFQERYSKRFLLLSREEAIQSGLFGSLQDSEKRDEILERLGYWIALSKKRGSIHYRYTGNEKTFRGKHGSLTADELYIPLLVFG